MVWRLGVERKNQAIEVDGDLHDDDAVALECHIKHVTAQLYLQKHDQRRELTMALAKWPSLQI